MSITPVQAADLVAYLVALGTLIATDNQGQAWADYLNGTVPGITSSETFDVRQRVVKTWAAEGRRGRIDAEHVGAAVIAQRRERVAAVVQAHGAPDPDGLGSEPRVLNAWRDAWRRAVEQGAGTEQAQEVAWRAVGRQPPPPAIEAPGPHGAERARAVLAALAGGVRSP